MTKKENKTTRYPHGCKTATEYENYLIEHPGSYHCKECGKHISSYFRDMSEYVWKIKKAIKGKVKTNYYCSYTCMRKAEKREELVKDKKASAKLLNKYNGVLSIKECKFLEELPMIIEQDKIKLSIKTREDFYNVIRKYYIQIADFFDI